MTERKGPQENIDREKSIKRDEQWFEQICDRSVSIDTTEIKKRIRIEINEQWLGAELNDDESSEVASRIRGQLHQHIAQQKNDAVTTNHKPHNNLIRSLVIVGSITGIAAMIALSFVGLGESVSVEKDVVFETSYADAFEQFSYGDFDESLNELSDELDQYAASGPLLSREEELSDDWVAPAVISATDG